MKDGTVTRGDDAGDGVLTLQEAADRLKVHYMTAYRWVRRGELPAFKAGGRLRVRRSDLDTFVRERTVDVTVATTVEGRTEWSRHVARLHELLCTGQGAEAGALVRKVVADGAAVTDVFEQLLAPAMHEVGDDWAAGRISVAEEHRASEIVRAVVARLGEMFRRRGPRRGTVVTATPPGERHGLGGEMLAHVLRGAGFEVHHLGTDVPLDDLAVFLDVVPADALCLSVTMPDLRADVLEGVVAAATGPHRAAVVIGGQGIDRRRATASGARYAATLADAPEALDEAIRHRMELGGAG